MTCKECVHGDVCVHKRELNYFDVNYRCKCPDFINKADVAEVRHGKWLNFYGEWSTAECDQCGECYEVSPDEEPKEEYFKAFKQAYKYCPDCGAKMGDDEE